VRSILYRFPDLRQFQELVHSMGDSEFELGLPAGETVSDGEWVLAIFELGSERRATSAAARATVSHEGVRLAFESRDWKRLAEFSRLEAHIPRRSGTMQAVTPSQAPVPTPRPASLPPSGRGAHILVVDDDVSIREMVATMLDAIGLVVTTAGSAEEAFDLLLRDTFHLAVLDWSLPGVTGLDLCKRIRSRESIATLPVLFLTANSSPQHMIEAFAHGADDYLTKPFRAPELGARIFALLRRARMTASTP
jgi:two-component system phosphate regulon response regulator PhoB